MGVMIANDVLCKKQDWKVIKWKEHIYEITSSDAKIAIF